MKEVILIGVVIFFAMNMGASGIAPTFSAVYGSRLINKKIAALLFTVFVILGAFTLGAKVAKTLGQGILPRGLINADVALVILASATLSLFVADSYVVGFSGNLVPYHLSFIQEYLSAA